MLSSQRGGLQAGSAIDSMTSIDRAAFVAVKPRAVAAEGDQVSDGRAAILEIDVVSFHWELSGRSGRYRSRF